MQQGNALAAQALTELMAHVEPRMQYVVNILQRCDIRRLADVRVSLRQNAFDISKIGLAQLIALNQLRHQAQATQIAVELKAVILRIAVDIGHTFYFRQHLLLHFLAFLKLSANLRRKRQLQIIKQMLIGLQDFFRCCEAVEVYVRNAVPLLHSLRQRQCDIMHDDVHLRCGSTADFLGSAAAGQLYAQLDACCLQKCVQLCIGKIAHALP